MADHKEVMEVSFKPAAGGMISETRTKGKAGKFGHDYENHVAVHGSIGHAARHLKKVMEYAEGHSKKSMSPRMEKTAAPSMKR